MKKIKITLISHNLFRIILITIIVSLLKRMWKDLESMLYIFWIKTYIYYKFALILTQIRSDKWNHIALQTAECK